MSFFSRVWAVIRKLTVVLDVVQGIIVGAVLAFLTALLLITAQVNAMKTTVNGWSITMTCGKASNGILLRAACAQAFFAVNLPEEAVYWTATMDGAGQTLTGAHDYLLHFPPGGLPPNQCLLVADHDHCAGLLGGQSDRPLQCQRPVGSGGERRWLHRHLHPAHRSGGARGELAPIPERELQAVAAGLSARRGHPERCVSRATCRGGALMANRDNHDIDKPRETQLRSASSPAAKARSRWKVHLLTFAVAVLVVWGVGTFASIYFYPRLLYNAGGERDGQPRPRRQAVPRAFPSIRSIRMPTLASPSSVQAALESTENRDTLYTVGWLDLSKGPLVLHVPDMAGRYYSVAVYSTRGGRSSPMWAGAPPGHEAGDYLISGPGWKGAVPAGVKQIVSPDNTVALIGRTLVYSDSDLTTAYGLAKQIQVTPLSQRSFP